MSKTAKYRKAIDLIKEAKRKKHKSYVDLKWILDESKEELGDFMEIINELCNLGVLREDVDVKSKRAKYCILKDNVDFGNDDESIYANSPDTITLENSSSREDGPKLRISENKWLDDSGTSERDVSELTGNFVSKEDFEKFKSEISLLVYQHKSDRFERSFFEGETINQLRTEILSKDEIIKLLKSDNERLSGIIKNQTVHSQQHLDDTAHSLSLSNCQETVNSHILRSNSNDVSISSTPSHAGTRESTWEPVRNRKSWNGESYQLPTTNNSTLLRTHNRFNNLQIEEHNETNSLLNVYKDFEDRPTVTEEFRNSPSRHQTPDAVRRRPVVVCDEKQILNNKTLFSENLKTVPGNSSYADVLKNGKKIYAFGDSQLNRISGKFLSKKVGNGRIYVRPFTSATTRQIAWHVEPAIHDDQPDVAVVHAGVNDVLQGETDPMKIATNIINVGKKCNSLGVNTILISSLFPLRNKAKNEIIKNVNNILKDLCFSNKFIFIDNSNISANLLHTDGIHLNNESKEIFSDNIVNSLNNTFL